MSTKAVYSTSSWRRLPRNGPCAVAELLGTECGGLIARHHVVPLSLGGHDLGRTVQVCAKHHPMLEALARRAWGVREWKRCPHHHRTREAREACEKRLNGTEGV